MTSFRQYSLLDNFCLEIDQALRAIAGHAKTSGRPYPAEQQSDHFLDEAQGKLSGRLMRVNHAGEVCAQALYQGQGLISKNPELKIKMQHAAIEEGDHLAWCHQRLNELSSHPSYLNVFWYAGSFMIGLTAGMIGDKWSLGFLAETEEQVVKHLESQLTMLPKQDEKSFKIIEQMRTDEAKHKEDAIQAGAKELPIFIKTLMKITSKTMVKLSYWI